MVEFGLFLIALAWFYQVTLLFKNNKEISMVFLSLYALGLFLVVIKGFSFGPTIASYLNIAALLLSTLTIILLKT